MFHGPSTAQSLVQCAHVNLAFLRPFHKQLNPTVVFEKSVVAPISVLLYACSPVAIIGRVWAIVVTALNSVFLRWSRPHVGEKIRKRLTPAVAHEDSSASVILVTAIFPVLAALADVLPDKRFRCFASSMGTVSIPSPFSLKTAAGCDSTTNNMTKLYSFPFATGTKAINPVPSVDNSGVSHNSQSSVLFADGHIEALAHIASVAQSSSQLWVIERGDGT